MNPTDADIEAIIRRLDLDADGKLTQEELIAGCTPQEPFSKLVVRERQKKADQVKKAKEEVKQAKQKGLKVSKKQD